MRIFIFWLLIVQSIIAGNPLHSQSINTLLQKATEVNDSADYFFALANKKIKTKADEAQFLLTKCIYHSKNTNTDSTLFYGQKAITLAKILDSTRIVMLTYRNIGIAYNQAGSYELASKYELEALKLAESKNDMEWISTFNRMLSLANHDFESYEKGVAFAKKAFDASLKVSPPVQTLTTYALNAIAINFDDWNKPDSALFYHYKVFNYLKGNDSLNYYFTYNNIGNTLLKQKQYKQAESWLSRALKIIDITVTSADSVDFYYDYATTTTNLATVAYLQRNYKQAEEFFDRAKYFSEKSENAEKLRDYYQQRYLFNKARKNIDEMAFYQERYIALRDSVFSSVRAKTFADLEKKYQTEKKEDEIKILNSENKRQKTIIITAVIIFILIGLIAYILYTRKQLKQKAALQKAIIKEQDQAAKAVISAEENERSRMSQTLHDGLGQLLSAAKMNLQAVQGNLQLNPQMTTAYDNALKLVDDSIKEMRGVSHQMVTNNVIRTGLANALKELIEKIDTNRLKVNLEVDGLLQNMNPDIQIVVYRILQESINNVIKHSQADALHISLKADQQVLWVSVADNGSSSKNSVASSNLMISGLIAWQ